jgi:hypothetical protein
MSLHPPKYTHNKRNTTRLHLPDGSHGDYYCQTCQKRWFSEDTVIWAVCKYFTLAGYTPSPADQLKREGDIKVTGHLNIEEWIIEAKGQVPAGNEHAAFKEGMGQILMAPQPTQPTHPICSCHAQSSSFHPRGRDDRQERPPLFAPALDLGHPDSSPSPQLFRGAD